MPEGWFLGILVLLGVLAMQLVLVVAVQRLRDTVRRRRGLPSLAEQRQRDREAHADDEVVPVGTGLPGVTLPRGRVGAAAGDDGGGSDRAGGSEDPDGAERTGRTGRADRAD